MADHRRIAIQTALGAVGLGLLAIPVVAVGLSGTATADALWTALRVAALEGFTLVFANIAVGAFRPLFNRFIKPRAVHRLHVATGSVGFCLVVAHAIMLLAFGASGYRLGFVWLGPAILVMLAGAILGALARRRLRGSWRWIHRLNYLVFAAALVHGFALGYDFGAARWLKILFLAYAVVVAAGLAFRLSGLRRPSSR